MIHGRLRDGRLTDISAREATHPDDVPLDAMPTIVGPMTYDAESRTAVPLPPQERSVEERLAACGLAPLQAALALRSSSGWERLSGPAKEWAQRVLDQAAAAATAALE